MTRLNTVLRNKRTFAVRRALEDRAGLYADLARATPKQRATALVIESGDLLLELLIQTATSNFRIGSGRRERRRDEKLLTGALSDAARVERAWVFLAHGVVQWTLARAIAAGAREDVLLHEAARRLLGEHYGLDERQQRLLGIATKAEDLGYYSEELVITEEAFECLLGDRAGDLALFAEDAERYTDIQLLEVAFEGGSGKYRELVMKGAAGQAAPGNAPPRRAP